MRIIFHFINTSITDLNITLSDYKMCLFIIFLSFFDVIYKIYNAHSNCIVKNPFQMKKMKTF